MDDDSDEVEAVKEDACEDEDQKFDTDNVALEDNEEYFEVQEYDAVVMRGDTLGEKEMNYTERAEAVNDNDVEDEGMVDGSETKDNPAPTVATNAPTVETSANPLMNTAPPLPRPAPPLAILALPVAQNRGTKRGTVCTTRTALMLSSRGC